MDAATFNKELQKYKIVRLEDHYRPRNKRKETAKVLQTPRSNATLITTNAKEKIAARPNNTSNQPFFWELLETALNDILNPAEKSRFIGNMKKELNLVQETLNLEELNQAAAAAAATHR